MAHVTYEGLRLTELAEREGVSKQAMSEMVADLVRLGYLRTKPDPDDGRAKLITFTAKGRRAVDAAMIAFRTIERRLGKAVGGQDMKRIRHSLLGIIATDLTD